MYSQLERCFDALANATSIIDTTIIFGRAQRWENMHVSTMKRYGRSLLNSNLVNKKLLFFHYDKFHEERLI